MVCPFGMRSSGWWWCRAVGILHRCVHRMWADVLHAGMIYIDDGIWIMDEGLVSEATATILLFLKMVGSPISWEKTRMGKQQDWCGYEVSLEEWSVGLTKSKQDVLSSSITDILTGGENIPFCDLQKLTSRMAWWGVAFPLVKPFLRNAFRCLGRMEEVGKRKVKGCFDEDTGAILPGKSMVVARAIPSPKIPKR